GAPGPWPSPYRLGDGEGATALSEGPEGLENDTRDGLFHACGTTSGAPESVPWVSGGGRRRSSPVRRAGTLLGSRHRVGHGSSRHRRGSGARGLVGGNQPRGPGLEGHRGGEGP